MQLTQPYYGLSSQTRVRVADDGNAIEVAALGAGPSFSILVHDPAARDLLVAAFEAAVQLVGADEALAEALHSGPAIARHLTVAREAIARAEKLA